MVRCRQRSVVRVDMSSVWRRELSRLMASRAAHASVEVMAEELTLRRGIKPHSRDVASRFSPRAAIVVTQAPVYLVVETSGSNAEHDSAKLDAFLEDAMGCVG